jgi:hypothetical protein
LRKRGGQSYKRSFSNDAIYNRKRGIKERRKERKKERGKRGQFSESASPDCVSAAAKATSEVSHMLQRKKGDKSGKKR